MDNIDEKLTVIFEKDGKQTIANSDISGKRKIVVVINNQFKCTKYHANSKWSGSKQCSGK